MTVPNTSDNNPVHAFGLWVLRFLARQRGTADVTVALLVPASAATFGLVLADLFPGDGTAPAVSGARWAVMLVSIGALIGAVVFRRWVYRGTGTLFSLIFLDETMPDFHEKAQKHAARHHMAQQVLGRRVDIAGREHNGAVDVVQPRQELSRAFENALNQDRQDTGYAVAPNLLWPAALAVGASLIHTDEMRFFEYGKQTIIYRLHDKTPERAAIRTTPDYVVAAPTGEHRGILLSFTPAAAKFETDRRCAEFGISDLIRIGPHPTIQRDQLTGPEMGRLADDLAGHLADIKRTTPDRELVVVAFIPKTVALLTGWYLARQQVRFFNGTHLMHYLHSEDRFVALRVHPSQPMSYPHGPRR